MRAYWSSLGLLALMACGGSRGDEDKGRASSADTRSIARGEYSLTNDDVGATLTVTATAPFTFSLTIVRQTGGRANGEIQNVTAFESAGRYVFRPADDCVITLRPGDGSVAVHQLGSCESQGFGAFVDGSGLYRPAVPNQGGSGNGIPDGDGLPNGNGNGSSVPDPALGTFSSGTDCRIEMTIDEDGAGANVDQDGTCEKGAGFGAFVDVTGHYTKVIPK